MISTPILETLAYDFGTSVEHVRNALEMIDAGLSAPFIGRFRRGQVDLMSESGLRRLRRRRTELEDLDRRRGTILRMLEKEPSVTPAQIQEIQRCMDRFELEDLFIPHRRPEPEVQLALDRGLGALADALVAPIPKAERVALLGTDAEEKDEDNDGDGDAPNARGSQSEDAPAGGGDGRAGEAHAAEAHVGEAHAGEAH
ncbi:MAG: Tex-like N-terminal domain-containing protein, partial [Planctomycetota bacterium]|nr:Tex-like N-terminal domain-containing protein [Planctomycetota bacterium]